MNKNLLNSLIGAAAAAAIVGVAMPASAADAAKAPAKAEAKTDDMPKEVKHFLNVYDKDKSGELTREEVRKKTQAMVDKVKVDDKGMVDEGAAMASVRDDKGAATHKMVAPEVVVAHVMEAFDKMAKDGKLKGKQLADFFAELMKTN